MRHRPRVLIVDDDPSEREKIELAAGELGAEVAWCERGEDGLARASSEPFDAILIDILMPDQSGYEICRKLKSQPDTSDAPLIFVAARNREEDVLPGFEALAFDFLLKPFHFRELKATLQNALRQKSLLDELGTLVGFYESCISLWHAFDDADCPDSAWRNVSRELERIVTTFEADGAGLSLGVDDNFLLCGDESGPLATEIPVAQDDLRGVFRLYRNTPCDAEEKLRLADLASTLCRGLRRFYAPGHMQTPSTALSVD